MAKIPEIPIKLADELDHVKDLPQDQDYYEDNGFMILANSEGHDILLWTAPNIIRGVGAGQWIVPDGRVHITQLIVIPQERRGQGMYDNNFVRSGWHPPQYLRPEDLKIVQENNQVIWKLEGCSYICRPPVWEVKGSHAGVEIDLTCQQLSPAIWQWGPFEKGMEQDHAGYETFISAQGTLKVAGQTFPIKNGLGVHERAVLGQSWDIIPELMGGNEFYWMLCMNNDFQMFMFRHTSKGIDYGQLRVEGQDISYMPARGLGSVSFTTLERWHDPRTGLYIPCKWHLTMASAQGIVDLDIVGQGRAYYHFNAKKGVLIMMWILSLANGAFYFPEGRSLPIKDTLVCAEWGQAILVAEETLNGPVA